MIEIYVKAEKFYQDYIVGKRTYIIAFVGALMNLLVALNIVPADGQAMTVVNGVLVFLGLGTLRAAK